MGVVYSLYLLKAVSMYPGARLDNAYTVDNADVYILYGGTDCIALRVSRGWAASFERIIINMIDDING